MQKGVAAVKRIAVPAAFIQAAMLVMALSYFFYPVSHQFFKAFIQIRDNIGALQFSFLSMGVIAVIAEYLNARSISQKAGFNWNVFLKNSAFGFIVFGVLGLITDLFYLFQNELWKTLPASFQIPAKVLTDQIVYTVLFANPYQTFLYVLKDCGFNRLKFVQRVTPFKTFYVSEVLAVLITNWAFWVPTTCILYSLPLELQCVISRLAILIWVLLLSIITKKD